MYLGPRHPLQNYLRIVFFQRCCCIDLISLYYYLYYKVDLLEKYIEELKQELVIDEMNVSAVQRRLPARRHFWAARLIQHKRDIFKLKKEKDEIEQRVAKELREKAITKLSVPESLSIAKKSNSVRDISERLSELELIVELLEKAEKNLTSMVWDIKNIVALMQMETL